MPTAFSVPDVATKLALFSPSDAAIDKLAKEYLPLVIDGLDDTAGYAKVHRARMDVKNKRVAVERVRKELKADALDYGRKVDAEAKRLTALLAPIEEHLLSEEKAVDDEKERIKNEARLKAEAEERARQEAQEAARKAAQEAEEARLKVEREAEEKRLQAERERLDAERKAIETQQAEERARQKAIQDELDEERRALEAEKQRLADIEAARLREIETKRREAEAADRARIETEQRIAREAAEAKAKAEAEEAARAREEALRPDREKLLSVAAAVNALIVPQVSLAAKASRDAIINILADAEQRIRFAVEGMTK